MKRKKKKQQKYKFIVLSNNSDRHMFRITDSRGNSATSTYPKTKSTWHLLNLADEDKITGYLNIDKDFFNNKYTVSTVFWDIFDKAYKKFPSKECKLIWPANKLTLKKMEELSNNEAP